MKSRRVYLLAILLGSIMLVAGCDKQSTGGKEKGKAKAKVTKIRIGWVYAMANAPVLIAKEKGFFKEQGIEVELHPYTSGPRVRQGLMSGQLDLAYIGAPPVYHWYAKGLKSKIIAKVNYGQAAVIVRKDSGITNLAGLKGKKFAGVKIGSGMDVLLRGYVIKEAGKMDPQKDLEIRPMKPGNMGAAVENKVVDGAFCWEPFTSKYVARGNTTVIMDMNKEVPKYVWYVIMAMPEAMRDKRDAIVKVLRAHKKAVAFLNSSPTAGNDAIKKAFHLTDVKGANGNTVTAETILANARKRLGWQAELGKSDFDFIQRLMNYSFDLGYIQKKLSAKDLIDDSFMKEASK